MARALGHGPEPMDGGPLNWTNWLAGVTCVYATLFGVGRILFEQPGAGLGLLCLAAACFAWIARNMRQGQAAGGRTPQSGDGIV